MPWRRPKAAARRGTPVDLVVVGLANPGIDYAHTRHNAGGDAVAAVAERHSVTLKIEPRQRARLGELTLGSTRLALAIPNSYMNESGDALPALLDRVGVEQPEQILVVHDELDLEVGRLQLKRGGGIAGHNGLRSVSSTLSTDGFLRLRIGIGRPSGRGATTSWVLGRPRGPEGDSLAEAIVRAADAIELVATSGIDAAMMSVNTRG